MEVAGVPVLHPANENPPPVRGENRLGSVEVDAIVNGVVGFLREGLRLLVKTAQQIERAVAVVILQSLGQHIHGTGQQHVFSVQLKEVRTLPHPSDAVAVLRQYPDEIPVEKIRAAVEQQLSPLAGLVVGNQGAVGAVPGLPELRVPEGKAAAPLRRLRNHRVPLVFLIVQPVPKGQVLALDLPDLPAEGVLLGHACVHQHMPSVRQGQGAARETAVPVAGFVRGHSRREIGPVEQVAAHRVSPVHGTPVGVVGMVLVKEVVAALIPGKAVGVVQPAHPGGQMERGTGLPGDQFLPGLLIAAGVP